MPAKNKKTVAKAKKAKVVIRTVQRRRVTPLSLTEKARNDIAANMQLMGLGALTKSITIPGESRPLRINNVTSQGSTKTAVAHLSSNTRFEYTATTLPSELPVMFMLTHSPVNPVWGTKVFNSTRTVRFSGTSAGAVSQEVDFALQGITDVNTPQCRPMVIDNAYYAYKPEHYGAFACSISAASFTGTGNVVVRLKLVQEVGAPPYCTSVVLPLAGGTGSIANPFGEAVWMTVDSVMIGTGVTSTTTSTISLVTPIGAYLGPMIVMPSGSGLGPLYPKFRTNAASLLLQNNTAEMYKSGTVDAARIDWNNTNVFNVSQVANTVGAVTPQLRYNGPAAKGLYTYMLPTQASLTYTDYNDPADYGVGTVNKPSDFEGVNVALWSGLSLPSGFSLIINMRYDAHVEFQTTLQLYNLGMPQMSQGDTAAVLVASGAVLPFTENPLHLARFLSLARSLMRHAAPYAAPLARRGIKFLANKADDYLSQF